MAWQDDMYDALAVFLRKYVGKVHEVIAIESNFDSMGYDSFGQEIHGFNLDITYIKNEGARPRVYTYNSRFEDLIWEIT